MSRKLEAALTPGLLEALEELAAEDSAEGLDVEQEVVAPATAVKTLVWPLQRDPPSTLCTEILGSFRRALKARSASEGQIPSPALRALSQWCRRDIKGGSP